MNRVLLMALASWLIPGASYAAPPCDIGLKVCSLAPGFDPDPYNANYSSPTCESPDHASQHQKDAIKAALQEAPNKVQTDICDVKQIFIIRDGSGNWGKWEDTSYPRMSGNMYITVHQDNIDKKFSKRQDEHLDKLQPDHRVVFTHSAQGTIAPVSEETYGLMYILAHELGHIKWRKANIRSAACIKTAFFDNSWTTIGTAKTSRWVDFGDDKIGTHSDDIPQAADAYGDELNEIYDHGFVTALGSTNPEEDFVEAFAIYALMKSSCQKCVFNITIDGITHQVNSDRKQQILTDKFNCVDKWVGTYIQ